MTRTSLLPGGRSLGWEQESGRIGKYQTCLICCRLSPLAWKLQPTLNLYRLTHLRATSTEGELKGKELITLLKQRIDGVPVEFLKSSGNLLKSLNFSFQKGILPLSLRQCLLTCLPIIGKLREFIKNWHPLSMLSVIYKLALVPIANRIKPLLNDLISHNQNGFVPGRYIGESILIYDILHLAKIIKYQDYLC